ncbi:Uncharacterized protein pbN1_29190 [Aromatoleum bremense]|nr:Uncharacterized protein pbN1_29190 [Aromatoleum bremense]
MFGIEVGEQVGHSVFSWGTANFNRDAGKLRHRSRSESRQRKKRHCCIGTTKMLIYPGRSFNLKLCNAASVCALSRNPPLERRRIRENFICCSALTAPRTVDLRGLPRRTRPTRSLENES